MFAVVLRDAPSLSLPPTPPCERRTQIVDSLRSKEPRDVLETLLWLAGDHFSSAEDRRQYGNVESIEHSKLFEKIRGREDVRKQIDILQKSGNTWVSEYAKLVASRDD